MKNSPASDNPLKFYTTAEAAAYCKRSVAVFRKHYGNGMLPDPKRTILHKGRKMRYYTLQECKDLKNFFQTMTYGKVSPKRRTRRAKVHNR